MKKSTIDIDKTSPQSALKDLNDLLNIDYKDNISDEASKLFDGFGIGLDEYNEFARGKGNLQEWVESNRILKGNPFNYKNADVEMMLGEKDTKLTAAHRPYLTQYINDKSKDKSIIKCRQSEFSESEINENLYLCCSRPYTNVRHIFPTSGMSEKMAREKITIAVERSPRIVRLVKKPFNLTSKSFINGSFYTVDSSWTDYQGRGPSSDKITFDEYESQNPQIEDIYSESTSHSELARRARISTPKFPNSGIDGAFKKGCQYEWYITCPRCKKEQIMEFPENLCNFFELDNTDTNSPEYIKKLDKVYIGCKYCGEYIDKNSQFYLKTSRWISKKPHLRLTRSSYRVTYMMLAWKTGKEILYKYHTFRFLHQFWNEVMGYAYVSPESKLTRDLFEQCQDRTFVNQYRKIGMAKNVSVGVDWGETSWVVVRANGFPPDMKDSKVIYVEKIDDESLRKHGFHGLQTEHVKRVEQICEFFGAKIIINDANGIGVDRNSYLVRRFPTKSYGCFYDTGEIQRQKRKRELITPIVNERAMTITVSRVGTFKLLIQEYEEKRVSFPRLDNNIEDFVDDKTGALYEVVGKTGQDHYAHADNYAKIGFDKLYNIYKTTSAGVIQGSSDTPENIIKEHPLL